MFPKYIVLYKIKTAQMKFLKIKTYCQGKAYRHIWNTLQTTTFSQNNLFKIEYKEQRDIKIVEASKWGKKLLRK